jgi:hypothetical protein
MEQFKNFGHDFSGPKAVDAASGEGQRRASAELPRAHADC